MSTDYKHHFMMFGLLNRN